MQEPLRALGLLSVIVPAYNAAPVLDATLAQVHGWLEQSGLEYEIIIVDDGSRDQTASIAQKLLAPLGARGRLLKHEVNRGKGAAVRTGMLAARGDWALFLDADHSTHINHAALVAAAAASGADVVIGSRRVKGANVVCSRPKLRQWLGDLFPLMTRMISRHGASDSQCGFKAVRRWAIEPVFSNLRTERFAFDIEMLLRARRSGAAIREIPVRWDNPSESTLRIARDGPSMLRDTIKVAWRLRRMGSEARDLQRQGSLARASQREEPAIVVEVPAAATRAGRAN